MNFDILYYDELNVLHLNFRSVVVITFASHAKGPRFEPGRKQSAFFFYMFESHTYYLTECIFDHKENKCLLYGFKAFMLALS